MSSYEDGWNEAIAVALRLLDHHGSHARDRIAELATYYPEAEQKRREQWADQWRQWQEKYDHLMYYPVSAQKLRDAVDPEKSSFCGTYEKLKLTRVF